MPTGFKERDGGYSSDLEDYLMRREYFSESNLFTWGNNNSGLLGDNSTDSKTSPNTTVGGGITWKSLAASQGATTGSSNFGAAIKSDGTLWTWGNNSLGQLGDGTVVARSSPGTTVGGGNWKQISCGYGHIAGIKTDGTLWTWGRDFYGALGTGGNNSRSSPNTTIGGGSDWKQIATGLDCNAALKVDGTLYVWGKNNVGQLGDNTSASKNSPVSISGGGTTWKSLWSGGSASNFMAAIKTDGTLWTWGGNASGQLGDGTVVNKSSPNTTAGGGTNWKQVAIGASFIAAIKTDGTLWTWGGNASGQLGNNSTTDRSSPNTTAGGGTAWKQTSAGTLFAAAIKTDGTLWAWGSNFFGELGQYAAIGTSKSSPTTVTIGTTWKQVSCGQSFGYALRDLTFF
jgi:hypothetical protein